MSNVSAIGFMAGYMSKEANPQAQALTPEQIQTLGPEGLTQYNQDMDSGANKFLADPNAQNYASIGGGAAIGGALGALGGGDVASTLMGTALGGIVGWLAKHFFPGQMDKAHQYAIDHMQKGTLAKIIPVLRKSNQEANADAESKGLEDMASKAETEQKTKESTKTIAQSTGDETGTEAVALSEAVKDKEKAALAADKERFEGKGGPFPQEAPQTQPVGTDTVLRPEAPQQPVPPLGPVTGQAPAPAEPYQQPDFSGDILTPTPQDPALTPGK